MNRRELLPLILAAAPGLSSAAGAQTPAQPEAPPDFRPQVKVRDEDYAQARRRFHTTLLRLGPSPQTWSPVTPPEGIREVVYSPALALKAWLYRPPEVRRTRRPAVLFLHGGHAFSRGDWDMAQAVADAGFVVMSPILRGENGQAGNFSMYYNEVDDVLAAANYLRRLDGVDGDRLFVCGHSVGGTMTMLAALASDRFRAAASLSGSPDQMLYIRLAPGAKERAPFDVNDPRELEMRSPLAFAGSFKCPIRIYYGSREPQFAFTAARTAEIARLGGIDAQVVVNEGNHNSHAPASILGSIAFFRGRS